MIGHAKLLILLLGKELQSGILDFENHHCSWKSLKDGCTACATQVRGRGCHPQQRLERVWNMMVFCAELWRVKLSYDGEMEDRYLLHWNLILVFQNLENKPAVSYRDNSILCCWNQA
mmetsp:Transcript_34589/g.58693  ORF Transcript_34589/g.58693 Transcript_34589/m.58693 type:complete len:117 (-) Transcript_34589:861-1211(-)